MSRTADDIPMAIIVDLSLLDISSLRYSERVRARNSPDEFAHHRTDHESRGAPSGASESPLALVPTVPPRQRTAKGRGGPKLRARAEQTAILLMCVIWATRHRRGPTPAHWSEPTRAMPSRLSLSPTTARHSMTSPARPNSMIGSPQPASANVAAEDNRHPFGPAYCQSGDFAPPRPYAPPARPDVDQRCSSLRCAQLSAVACFAPSSTRVP